MVALKDLPRERLQAMAEGGEQILECYRVMQKTDHNIVGLIIEGHGTFYEYDHYPPGDVYDHETHSQYYYHSHREHEHGHFHTFLREAGMPADCRPIEQSEADYMTERDDTITHLIAISMNPAGYPIALFTTNRWVTADNWYVADDVISMLDTFCMDLVYPSWPVNIWVTGMLALFRPQIEDLIRERDATVEKWRDEKPDEDIFEHRDYDLASIKEISVEKQIRAVKRALAKAA